MLRTGRGIMTSNKDEDKNNSQGNSKSTSDKVSSQIDNIALRPLCEFWEEVRGDRLLPEASEIDPAQIAYILKDIAILDVIDEMTIRYRLAGTAISERTGNDPTGGNLIDMVAPDKRQLVSQIMNTIIAHPVGTIATYEDVYQSGKRALVESLYLPLQKVDDSVGRIVSVHLWKETLTYEQEQPEPVVAAKIRSIQWLDIGAGTPEDSPY
jgi:hypothetical protein